LKSLHHIFARLGFVRKERERSLLFVGDNELAFEALSPLIEEVLSRDSRLRIILSSADGDICSWLKERFPQLLVLPVPYGNWISSELFLRQLKIRVVAFIETGALSVSDSFIARLKQFAIGIVTVSGRTAEPLTDLVIGHGLSEAAVLVNGNADKQSLKKGVSAMTILSLADMLDVMLARDLKALRKPNMILQSLAETPARISASSRWRKTIAWRVKRYQNIDELKDRLASPKTILCLGNGPSSESTALESITYDVLFRVNHSWLKRGLLVKADVVFTGGRPSMRAISGVIFGVPTMDAEHNLLSLRTYNPLFGPTEFFNVNDMTSRVGQYNWGHLRPTNGVCMLATAIALQPERLIVAGIDLFQHPDGSYPGDNATVNAYSPGHSRETELGFVVELLNLFKGELIIVGEILRKTLENQKLKTS
jgi:hypothetical protein